MRFAESARQDLNSIYSWNYHYWGELQADRYQEFLLNVCTSLESGEISGSLVAGREEFQHYLAKWKRAKHGHRIIFRLEGQELTVIRMIHSAMEFPRYFSD